MHKEVEKDTRKGGGMISRKEEQRNSQNTLIPSHIFILTNDNDDYKSLGKTSCDSDWNIDWRKRDCPARKFNPNPPMELQKWEKLELLSTKTDSKEKGIDAGDRERNKIQGGD